MIPIKHGGSLILNQQLGHFERAQAKARQKSEEAHKLSAEAGARLMADLTNVLGLGVLTLANKMVRRQEQLIDQLVQIADLVAGGCDMIKTTIFDYGVEGTATIVLMKTPGGIAVEMEVSQGANPVTKHSAENTASTLSTALGFEVPVVQKTERLGGKKWGR